ncbi:homocysteine S-methyltransferase [Flavobacteriaceae bacterium]|nr:homocysteine S-methyltransferase [Flavobacteriaceae bacterium]
MKSLLKNLKYPLILDGGLSNVLESFGCNLNHELWVANLLDKNPEAIMDTHLAYLNAGAQIISTASYQATIPGFMKLGFSRSESEGLILKSVDLARSAINQYCTKYKCQDKPLLAGSIGPYGAYLANGSEYRGDYNVSKNNLLEFHLKRIQLLDASNCDLIALETIPSFFETQVLSTILKTIKTPSWISFSCKDGQYLNDGTSIKKAALLLKNHPTIFAFGVNCTAPKYISSLIQELKSIKTDKKIIIYPNAGDSYHVESKTWMKNSNPKYFTAMSKEWFLLGADIVGGCCQIGPSHIKSLVKSNKLNFYKNC